MKHTVDLQFLEESARFRLQFNCEQCVHFAADRGECAEGYPNQEHAARSLQPGDTVSFCKLFELS